MPRDGLIDAYLRQLKRALKLDYPTKARILEEVRDHLLTAVEEFERRGYSRLDAERRAIERFGLPTAFAAQYSSGPQPTSEPVPSRRAPRHSRRTKSRMRRSVVSNSPPAGDLGSPRCSFCGKPHEKVQDLIPSPEGVTICDECLRLCTEILSAERGNAGQPPEARPPDASRYYCSFCGREHADVERLIAGPRFVFICNKCVETFTANAVEGAPVG